MLEPTRRALVRRLSRFDSVIEIGIGRRTELARDLAAAGVDVTAIDICEREVPPAVTFVVDDVTNPDWERYPHADAVYALNLPPELHRPGLTFARALDAAFLFTTLGGDQPAVPVTRQSVPGDTLYTACERDGVS